MAEYIEREKVLHEMTSNPLPNDTQHLYLAMRNMVKKAPAADVVEVRYGKWIKGRKEKLYYNDDMSGFYDFPVTCSVCKFDITDEGFYETDFCPNCGAKMDGEKNEAN